MYTPFTLALKYTGYLLGSSSGKGHGIHSPFLFDFIQNVLNDKKHYKEYGVVESLRQKLLADTTPLPMEDYGAGSSIAHRSGSVASIVASAAKNKKYGQLLFRIVQCYQPHYIVELGTSLGISTAYLALPDRSAVVVTGEGNYAVASLAKKNFELINVSNVQVITGNFDNTLPEITSALPRVDLAFIDANHRRTPTLKYFRELSKKMSESSMIIFDDIHWSRGMELAWKEIRNDPSVMLSVDMFFLGIVFFRPEFKVKQHFTIRF